MTELGLKQGSRNVTKSEGATASETSISPRAKTNPSTIYFYADLCLPCPGESFSAHKIMFKKGGNYFKNNFGRKVKGSWPPWPLPFLRLWIERFPYHLVA